MLRFRSKGYLQQQIKADFIFLSLAPFFIMKKNKWYSSAGWLGYVSLIVILVGTACQQQVDFQQAVKNDPGLGEGNAGMMDLLRLVKQKIFRNWDDSSLFVVRENAPIHEKMFVANNLLNQGQTKKVIDMLNNILEADEKLPDDVRIKVKTSLAVAYIRLAEDENCVLNHSPNACILPLQPDAVHQLTTGSARAIELYKKLLAGNPDDLPSRWLLNIAYMTLGQYPDSVPQEFYMAIPQPKDSAQRFDNVAPKLGLDVFSNCGGAIMEDLNNDGWVDVFFTDWGLDSTIRYFGNNGDGTFTDLTRHAGLDGLAGGLNTIHADYDNDGFKDILILRGAWGKVGVPNSLLKNNGDQTFTDVTKQAGLLSFHPGQVAVFADFNRDSWLDLFIGNETVSRKRPHPCELFLNNGDGTFSEIARAAGIDITGFVKGATAGDFDNDGYPDIYVSCFRGENYLFHNKGNAGRIAFEDVTASAGVREPYGSFPTWFWDFNNDGWLDIFVAGYERGMGRSITGVVSDMLGTTVTEANPVLYRNNGNGTFTDVTKSLKLDRPVYTMGANFGDVDNDGWLDIYLGTGEPDFRAIYPNRLFRNRKGKVFDDETATFGLGHIQKGHGIAFGDIDNDGDQDILVELGGAIPADGFQNALFENPGNRNRWITLIPEGTQSNRDGIGARIRVRVETDEGVREIHRTVGTGGSFGSSTMRQEIGLGQAEKILSIEINWPASDLTQNFESVDPDQIIHIVEGVDTLVYLENAVIDFDTATNHHHNHSH